MAHAPEQPLSDDDDEAEEEAAAVCEASDASGTSAHAELDDAQLAELDDDVVEAYADAGVPRACYEVGRRHLAAGLLSEAAAHFGRAAETGGGRVSLKVGGKRLPRSRDLPATRGDADAMVALAALHYCGRHDRLEVGAFVKDMKTCVRWLEVAAARGRTDAMDALGYCHFLGHGVAEDKAAAERMWAESIDLQRKAAAEGPPPPKRPRGRSPPPPDRPKAREAAAASPRYRTDSEEEQDDEPAPEATRKSARVQAKPPAAAEEPVRRSQRRLGPNK